MDKNLIKEHLRKTFVSEADTPGISVTEKAKKESGKINKQGLKDYAKVVEKDTKKEDKEMSNNKFNYTDKFQKTYHDEMEIMNGQEMLQYDMKPSEEFKKKAKEGIEGSSKMGNENKVGNAEAAWEASSDNFGKDLVKRIKSSTEKRSKETPTLNLRGRDIQADKKDTGHRPYAIEENQSKVAVAADKKVQNDKKKADFVPDEDYEKISREVEYGVGGENAEEIKENIFNTPQMGSVTQSNGVSGYINNTSKMDKEYSDSIRKRVPKFDYNGVEISKFGDDLFSLYSKTEQKIKNFTSIDDAKKYIDNNNNKTIKESMKRLKFKSAFNGLGNALKLIPESYRTDNKVFEMTDGNESYKIRWEGTLNEGKAVVLMASDNKLVNEDINRMKALFGYKSQETLGLVKGNARIDENKTFGDMLNKMKKLMTEGEDMMETEAPKPKEGNWEEEKKKAPEATKDITTAKGKKTDAKATEKNWEEVSGGEKMMETEAPKAKESNPDKAVKQAPEAKKDVSTAKGKANSTAKPAEKNWEETSGGEKMMDSFGGSKPKEGHWEDNPPSQAPEAKKHVHLKESEIMSEEEGEEIEVDSEEETDAPDSDNWSKPDTDFDDTTEKEPASSELGGIPMDDPEDEVVVPKPSAKGGYSLLSSPSTGIYVVKGPGLPLDGVQVPAELMSIASDKSRKASERASIIAKKLEEMSDEAPMDDEEDMM